MHPNEDRGPLIQATLKTQKHVCSARPVLLLLVMKYHSFHLLRLLHTPVPPSSEAAFSCARAVPALSPAAKPSSCSSTQKRQSEAVALLLATLHEGPSSITKPQTYTQCCTVTASNTSIRLSSGCSTFNSVPWENSGRWSPTTHSQNPDETPGFGGYCSGSRG